MVEALTTRVSLLSAPPGPGAPSVLRDLLNPGINRARRTQLVGDPMVVFQFNCVWGDVVGFLARPRIAEHPPGVPVAVGNFTDAIGEPHPIMTSLDILEGFFVTLVCRGDAEALGSLSTCWCPMRLMPPTC